MGDASGTVGFQGVSSHQKSLRGRTGSGKASAASSSDGFDDPTDDAHPSGLSEQPGGGCRRLLRLCVVFAVVFAVLYAAGMKLYNSEAKWIHKILDEAIFSNPVQPHRSSYPLHSGYSGPRRPSSARVLEDPLRDGEGPGGNSGSGGGASYVQDLAAGVVEIEDTLQMMRQRGSRSGGSSAGEGDRRGGGWGRGGGVERGRGSLKRESRNTTEEEELENQMALWSGHANAALRDEEAEDTLLSGRRGRPCESQQDCTYGSSLVCVRNKKGGPGTCQCTVLRSGSDTCAERHKAMPQWCVLDVADRALGAAAQLRTKSSSPPPSLSTGGPGAPASVASASASAARLLSPGSGKDLEARANWETCAVVASSRALLSKRHGSAIDRHTAVIRFNDAPTRGFEQHVGSKTTLRVQNVERCGFAESKGEMCLQYTQNHACRNPAIRDKGSSCTWIKPSRRLLDYVQLYWAAGRPSVSPKSSNTSLGPQRKLSTGFLGLSLALHLCGKVDVYGFESSERHYFRRQREARTSFATRHSWQLERRCVNHLRSNKGLKGLVTFR